jgi:AcrR family transcriptional regulator
MVSQRLTRIERKERTRADIVAAARESFLHHGFHGASLDLIAEDAGYSKGAVYSNFESKDDLFLAILDAHFALRMRRYTDVALDEERLEDAYRAVARVMYDADRAEPEWGPLLLEFWAHASRRPSLRKAVVERRTRFLDSIAALIDELLVRHHAELKVSAKEAAKASGGLMRGVAVEWMLDPPSASGKEFEEMHVALMAGLTKTPTEAER